MRKAGIILGTSALVTAGILLAATAGLAAVWEFSHKHKKYIELPRARRQPSYSWYDDKLKPLSYNLFQDISKE